MGYCRMFRVPIVTAALLLGVAACGGNGPVDKAAETGRTDALPNIKATAPSAAGEPHVPTQPAQPLPASSVAFPSALQGRWGLTPADCTPGRSDAKGLLAISRSDLRFYESRAVPGADVSTDEDSAAGNFHYEGEGRSWIRYEALKVDKGRLTRTETKPSASFTYAKCG
jgi:predicted small lipoprotein YifL